MSNEIKLSVSLTDTNGNFIGGNAWFENNAYTQNTLATTSGTLTTATGAVTLSAGNVNTLGYLMLKNLDNSASINWGVSASGNYVLVGQLKPNEVGVFRTQPSVTLKVSAASGTPNLQYWWLSD